MACRRRPFTFTTAKPCGRRRGPTTWPGWAAATAAPSAGGSADGATQPSAPAEKRVAMSVERFCASAPKSAPAESWATTLCASASVGVTIWARSSSSTGWAWRTSSS